MYCFRAFDKRTRTEDANDRIRKTPSKGATQAREIVIWEAYAR